VKTKFSLQALLYEDIFIKQIVINM